jgi:putative glycosyltransferase (TIGR04348 family)
MSAARSNRKPILCLVTPVNAKANNGNWQTTRRWCQMLGQAFEVQVVQHWDGSPADAMLALHARRSAASIHAFAAAHPDRPLVVALTGTDLYRDIDVDQDAQRSLQLATRLIVLHETAPDDVPLPHRAKVVVCFQSTPARATLPKTGQRLRAVLVGHLRSEKDPLTAMRAMQHLQARRDIVVDHIGEALDAALGRAAQACAQQHANYRWLGGMTHPQALKRIQRAHVLVHPSVMEGGAHVVMEAVRCGTPVIASRMPGNVGLLGQGYAGYFPVGDEAALAAMLVRARDEPKFLALLQRQCAARSRLFEPALEARTLLKVMRG